VRAAMLLLPRMFAEPLPDYPPDLFSRLAEAEAEFTGPAYGIKLFSPPPQ